MKKFTAALLTGALLNLSCSYVASEMATRQTVAGTTVPVEAPITKTAPLQFGYSFGLTLAGIALVKLLPDGRDITIRKLTYDCLAQMSEEELKKDEYKAVNICRTKAEIREARMESFWSTAMFGKCRTGGFNQFFRIFREYCWNEAVENIKNEYGEWEPVLASILYDSALVDCMPDPIDYKTKEEQQELQKKYNACLKKAIKETNEKWAEIYPKVVTKH